MKLPRNQKGVREFLGMVGYYREIYKWICQCHQTHDKADKERCQVWMDRGMSDWIWVPEDVSNWGPNSKVSLTHLSSIWSSWMPWIRLPQLSLPKNIPASMEMQRKCPLSTFLHSSLTPILNGALWSRKGTHILHNQKMETLSWRCRDTSEEWCQIPLEISGR